MRSNKPFILLPDKFDAVIFDMDGVVTKTAEDHIAAWKETFDRFFKEKFPSNAPFDPEADYHKYVDGKPRYDGVASFLASRNINLPRGTHEDAPGFETICAIGNLKNQIFLKRLQDHHAQAYKTTVAFIQSLKKERKKVAVITASENGAAVLKSARVDHLFDAKVDGIDTMRLNLKGKPAPDIFLEAAKQLGVQPKRAIVIEDAVAGVEAGSKGNFGFVIGIDRDHNTNRLKEHGATIVVKDLDEVKISADESEEYSASPIDDQNWIVVYKDFVPELEGRREALCALGNGYFVTRASAPEAQASNIHFPGTYFAGVYNRLRTEVAGFNLEHEDLVNMPNWLSLTFKIEDGDWFSLERVKIISYEQKLNLQEGILYRQVHFKDDKERETTLSEKRFVHMRHHHLAGLETKITAHNWSGKVIIRSALDGRVTNSISVYSSADKDKTHLEPIESSVTNDILYLKMQTSQSKVVVAQAAQTKLFCNDGLVNTQRTNIVENNYVAQDIEFQIKKSDSFTIQKTVSLFTIRDHAISEVGLAAKNTIINAPEFNILIEDQRQAWQQIWSLFDLVLETKKATKEVRPSLLLHLNSFHTLGTISYHSIDHDVGIPARGWSEGYQGHIFWDDLFVFPFLNLRAPLVTQSLLKYRHRRLGEAKKLAKDMGVCGARFPWQSGSTGREETPAGGIDPEKKTWNPDYSHLQIHVNAAIAFNIWQYYQATGDLNFMYVYGADLLFEIARFFAHFAKYNPKRDRYEIHGIVGPDEYHVRYPGATEVGINNNAYTNLMAVWTISRALDLLEIFPEEQCNEICRRLRLSGAERKLWDDVSHKMFIPIQSDGIISEFEGYENLLEFPLGKDGFIDLERLPQILKDTAGLPDQYKISKQADVLMLFYLFSSEELKELFERLNYKFSGEQIPKNIEYYLRQTANNSSLSRVVLAWVLSRMNRPKSWSHLHNMSANPATGQSTGISSFPSSWNIFQEALITDFLDIQKGSTAHGLHLGAMAGTIDIVQRCYTGIVTKADVLWLNPRLPEEVKRLSFHLHYRHQFVQLEITQEMAKISTNHRSPQAIKIGFKDKIYQFPPGTTKVFHISSGKVIPSWLSRLFF